MKCFKHKRPAAKAVPNYENITKVEDFHRDGSNDPVNPAGIAPYARESTTVCNSPACGSYVAGNTDPICEQWDYWQNSVGPGYPEIHPAVGIEFDKNDFQLAGTIDLSGDCRAKGRRAVRARKIWQGVPPLTDLDYVGGSPCTPIPAAPTTVRYRTVKRSVIAHARRVCTSMGVTTLFASDFHFSNTKTAAKNSGVVTLDEVTITGSEDTFDGSCNLTGVITYTPAEISNLISTNCGGGGGICLASEFANFLGIGLNCDLEMYSTAGNTFGWQDRWFPLLNDLYDSTYVWAGSPDPLFTMTGKSKTSTRLAFSVSSVDDDGGGYDIDFVLELSNPYTAEEATQDAYDLLAYWDLSLDALWNNKWYDDDWITVSPMIFYDEHRGDPDNFTFDPAWTDPVIVENTGNIVGKPQPIGNDPYFDFTHKIYEFCIVSSVGHIAVSQYGAKPSYSPSTGNINTRATRWTNEIESGSGFRGAWVKNEGENIEVQKWAEVDLIWPSYRFSRPCGLDKWLFDEPNTGCITLVAGSTVTVSFQNPETIADGDKCIVCGTGTVDGMWTVVNNHDGTYTLDALISGLPVDFLCDGMIFGKARFPDAGDCDDTWNSDKPRKNYVRFEWTSNWRDIAIDPTLRLNQFINGMPQNVDTFLQSDENFTWNRCHPVVMCFSPNGETWESGNTHPFPAAGDVRIDGIYGFEFTDRRAAAWMGDFLQAMPDPLWEAPHFGCDAFEACGETYTGGCNWLEDDGSGLADAGADFYFAHRPMVEARVTLPAGAPALPAGAHIGGLTLLELDAVGPLDGIVYPPPLSPQYDILNGVTHDQIWTLFTKTCQNIEDSARFNEIYQDYNYTCNDP